MFAVDRASAPDTTPVVPGLRKPSESSKPSYRPLHSLPHPPPAPKEIPGLEGVVLKGQGASKTTVRLPSPLPSPSPSPLPFLPPPAPTVPVAMQPARQDRLASNRMDSEHAVQHGVQHYQEPNKRVRMEHKEPHQRDRAPPHRAGAPRFDDWEDVPSRDESLIEELRQNFDSLAAECNRLREENAALKATRVVDDVEALIAQQDEKVVEHEKKTMELVYQWRQEAERLEALLEAEGGGEQQQRGSVRLTEELTTVQQELLDAELALAEKNKIIARLEKRNALLERYARIVETQNKCIGTDDVELFASRPTASVQVPSVGPTVPLMQARAMAPEGASGSAAYAPPIFPPSQTTGRGLGVDAPFPLPGQRTVPHITLSNSDMQLVNGTAESVRFIPPQVNVDQRRRRASLPVHLHPGPGQNAVDVSRRIRFYSNSESQGIVEEAPCARQQLPTVEEGVEEDQQLVSLPELAHAAEPGLDVDQLPTEPLATNTESLPLPPRDRALSWLFNIEFTPIKGKMMYTHQPTGYKFTLGPAPADSTEEGDAGMDTQYCPLALGDAGPFLLETSLGEALLDEFCFKSEQRTFLMEAISKALARAERGLAL